MEYFRKVSRRNRGCVSAGAGIAAAVLVGLFAFAPASHAQQPAKKPAPAAPAKKAPAQAKQAKGDWLKLCADREAVNAQGVMVKQKVCVVQQERLSAINGSMIVSAGLRQISGAKNEQLVVQVSLLPNVTGAPYGLAIPPGAQLRIDKEKEIPLKFSYCHVGGCTAETVATKEIVDKMKKGKEVVVIFTNSLNKRLGLPLPLNGFTKAYEGKPYDTKKYQEKIRAFLAEVQKKQLELAKRARAAQQKKAGGGAPQPAPQGQQPAPKKKP